MKPLAISLSVLALAWCFSGTGYAQDAGSEEGEALYNKQCATCHGLLPAAKTGKTQRPGLLAVAPGAGAHTVLDAGTLAVAPLYGPPLQGVLGRTAGTFEGYTYSKSFLQKMSGQKWDEGSIDLWITNSQKVVPGSFMFYSQKDAGIRGKIIAYLKTR